MLLNERDFRSSPAESLFVAGISTPHESPANCGLKIIFWKQQSNQRKRIMETRQMQLVAGITAFDGETGGIPL